MLKREPSNFFRVTTRWTLLSAALGALLFFAAGTLEISSLRNYLLVFWGLLLATMLAARPDLVEERSHPAEGKRDAGTRLASGFLFLVTLTAAALDVGRLHASDTVPRVITTASLVTFALATLIQAWAMAVNPFFSPTVRIQSERGHHLVTVGPYRVIRHPGYLAMLVSVPASALAIGSWLALIPGLTFSGVIARRATIEDEFLKLNLVGYSSYALKVRSRLVPSIW